jgi:hypothetical protein
VPDSELVQSEFEFASPIQDFSEVEESVAAFLESNPSNCIILGKGDTLFHCAYDLYTLKHNLLRQPKGEYRMIFATQCILDYHSETRRRMPSNHYKTLEMLFLWDNQWTNPALKSC